MDQQDSPPKRDVVRDFALDMAIGTAIKDALEEAQQAYDANRPVLNKTQCMIADMIQVEADKLYDGNYKKFKAAGRDMKGMDEIAVRLWSPVAECALVQLNDYLMKEYGLFPSLGPSSGLQALIPGVVYYIKFMAGKGGFSKLLGVDDEPKQDKP